MLLTSACMWPCKWSSGRQQQLLACHLICPACLAVAKGTVLTTHQINMGCCHLCMASMLCPDYHLDLADCTLYICVSVAFRYWLADSYEERHAAGQEPQSIDKEFLRLWFRERCDPYKDKVCWVWDNTYIVIRMHQNRKSMEAGRAWNTAATAVLHCFWSACAAHNCASISQQNPACSHPAALPLATAWGGTPPADPPTHPYIQPALLLREQCLVARDCLRGCLRLPACTSSPRPALLLHVHSFVAVL